MKKIFGIALALLVTASASAAQLDIPITRSGFTTIDQTGAEIIRKSNNAGAGNQFNWGGYNAGTANAVSFGLNVIQFNSGAAKVGSYCYTRFDTSAITESATEAVAHNVPSVIHDASAAGTVISVQYDYNTVVACEMAVLIRDANRWYESSPKPLPVLAGIQTVVYDLDGASAVTWTPLDMADANVMNMDQVISSGEGPLAYSTGTTPDFTTIQGIGLVCKAATTAGTNFGMSKITIGPAVASVHDWSER